jgi:hypothetical protein
MGSIFLAVLLNLGFLAAEVNDSSPTDLLLLARLGCSEAGTVKNEVRRVFRVVYNRAKSRGTTVMEEATRPGQFAFKNCTGVREKWLRWFHFELALDTLSGSIEAEAAINAPNVTFFGTKHRLSQPHSRCKGYTIREVWKWFGLKKVKTTKVGHEYYSKGKGNPGCPKSNGHPRRHPK